MTTKISSRRFNQDVSGAKRAALEGPVVITVRGRPSHVLLSIADYERIVAKNDPIGVLLSNSEAADIAVDFPRLGPSLLEVEDWIENSNG